LLVVVHLEGLLTVLAEFAAALGDEERDGLEGMIGQAHARQGGADVTSDMAAGRLASVPGAKGTHRIHQARRGRVLADPE
jgi:hypothetical protein